MRIINMLLMLLLSSISFGQELKNQNIGDLQKQATRLENEIKIRTDSLNFVKEEIKHLQNQEYLAKFKPKDGELVMNALLKMDGKLRKSSSPMSEIITYISKNDTVKLTDYQFGYWIVNKDQYFGYLSELYLDETEEIIIFKKELLKINEEFRLRKEKEDGEKKRLENEKETAIQKQKELEYRQSILRQFGKETGQKLLEGYYWIGMTAKMAKISLGEPRSINQTVGSWGVHEQWVYYSLYLYFEDGIVSSYQNSK
jgi:hypothetical protein